MARFMVPLAAMVGLVAVLVGCATRPEVLAVCPGKPTTQAALEALAERGEQALPLRANGQAVLTYHVPEKRKPERHRVPLQFWFSPPMHIYVQGSIAVDPRAVTVGSNEEEFWMALRPEEMSSYYRGRWEDSREFEGLLMSPRIVLEAFGVVMEPGGLDWARGRWSLTNRGAFDILTLRNEFDRVVKRLHVYACDYVVRKIEYFDMRGAVAARVQFRDYEVLAEGFRVPKRIDIVATGRDGRRDTIQIDVKTVKQMEFSEQQLAKIFVPPKQTGFDNVYRFERGRWIER